MGTITLSPPSYLGKLGEDADTLLHNTKLGLEWSFSVKDLQRGVGFYVRLINRCLLFKYELSEENRVFFINFLIDCIKLPEQSDMALVTKWIGTLTLLLKKQKTPLNISWKFVYDLAVKVIPFPSAAKESSYNGRIVEKHYLEAVVRLAHRVRKHYDPSSHPEAIFSHFRPFFSPHDCISFSAQTLFVHLFPTHSISSSSPPSLQQLEEVLTMWGWVNGVDEWDFQWVSLLTRWAKDQPSLDWSPYLGLLFQRFLRIFDLSVAGGSSILQPTKHGFATEAYVHVAHHKLGRYANMAKLIAYMEREDGRVQNYLDQLFASIGSYFHPSNGGEWSEGLGDFIENLCKYYAKRGLILSDRFLANVDQPLQYALYSKRHSMRYSAVKAYMHLAYVSPSILDNLLPKIYDALETVTAAHQTRAVLELLATIAHPLFSKDIYPKGGNHMSLLSLTLPGIDANDLGKTTAVYKFYYRLLTVVPLIEGGDSSAAQTEYDQEAFSATFTFSDWVVSFVERTLAFLSNKEEDSSAPLQIVYGGAVGLFFMQLSEPLFIAAIKKLYSTVTVNVYEKSIKEVAFMCNAAGHARPAIALRQFIPFYYKTIVNVEKSGEESLQTLSETQLYWHLTLLAYLVANSGAELIQYEKQIMSILKVTLTSEETKVYKAAHKLLRSALSALVQYYPLDYRSTNPDVWNSKDFQDHHYMYWGKTQTEYSVAWHEPSAAECELAARIVNATLTPTLSSLSEIAACKTPYTRAPSVRQLALVRAVLRGAAPLLRPAVLPHTPPCSPEPRDHRGWCALVNPPVVVCAFPQNLILSSVRGSVAEVVHQWAEFLSSHKPDEIVPNKILCKIGQNLFTNYGITHSKYNSDISQYTTLKNKWKNTKHLKTRNFVVSKALLLHSSRLNEDSFYTSSIEAGWTKVLLKDLHKLSLNQYTAVRVKAQSALLSSVRRHPLEVKPLAHTLLQALGTSALENKDSLTGVLHLLASQTILRKLSTDWALRSAFASALVACIAHQQLPPPQKDPVWDHHTTAYFTRFVALSCVQFRSIPLILPSIGPSKYSGNIPQETLQQAQETIVQHNITNKQAFHNIVRSLASVLEEKSTTNWKFKVIAAAQALWLLKSATEAIAATDVNPDIQSHVTSIVRWLVVSAGGDSPPLRSIATRFIASLLRTIKSPYQYAGSVKNFQWWNQCSPAVSDSPTTAPVNVLAGFLHIACPELQQKEFVGRLVQNLQEDHVFKSEEEQGGGLDPILASATRKFHAIGRFTDIASVLGQFTGLLSSQPQHDAAASLLGELLRSGRRWPYTRTPLQAEGFSTINARLFKGLFKLYGTNFVEIIKPHVERLLTQSERSSQSTAAEILAGALRIIHKRGIEAANADATWASAVTWITSSLLTATLAAPPECIIDWMACVRFGVYNIEPSRVTWLVERLLQSYGTSTTASSQAKPLYYIKAVLNEVTWRSPSLHERVISSLSNSLAHPYKQLRQEIGEIISAIIGFSWHPVREATSNKPLLAPPTLPEYLRDFLTKAFAESNKAPSEPNNDEATARISHIRATLLHATTYTFSQGSTQGLLPSLGALVGPLFAAQSDPDHDVVREARQVCGLVAQAYHWPSSLESLLPALYPVAESSSWRIRSALLPFLQILAYNNIFSITTADTAQLYKFVISMLNDNQVEVRELARGTLSSLIKGISTTRTPKNYTEVELAAHFSQLAKGAERHVGVLGLAALVGAHPYDLPSWMPEILVALAHQVGGKVSSISDTAKKGLMEFWRTHQDTWAEDQHLLTPDQRDALKERLAAPSYYA